MRGSLAAIVSRHRNITAPPAVPSRTSRHPPTKGNAGGDFDGKPPCDLRGSAAPGEPLSTNRGGEPVQEFNFDNCEVSEQKIDVTLPQSDRNTASFYINIRFCKRKSESIIHINAHNEIDVDIIKTIMTELHSMQPQLLAALDCITKKTYSST